MPIKIISTYPECAKLDQYVRTFCETRALAGEDLKSKDEISGAKGRPKTRGSHGSQMSCDMSDYPCEMEHMAGNGTSRRHGSSRSIERQGSDLLGIYLKLLNLSLNKTSAKLISQSTLLIDYFISESQSKFIPRQPRRWRRMQSSGGWSMSSWSVPQPKQTQVRKDSVQ